MPTMQARKANAALTKVEAVEDWEDKREYLEESVEYTVEVVM